MENLRIGNVFYSSGDQCIVCPYGGRCIANCCEERCVRGRPESICTPEEIKYYVEHGYMEWEEEWKKD